MYLLTNGVTIKAWTDLKDKEVNIGADDAAFEVVFKYLLSQNGVDPDEDLILKYIASPEELAQAAIDGNSKITVLSEPWVSVVLSKNSNIKIALDLQEEWTRINGTETPLAQTCLVVKTEIAARDPKEFSLFLKDYEDSIN